jgi:hypothetical protein
MSNFHGRPQSERFRRNHPRRPFDRAAFESAKNFIVEHYAWISAGGCNYVIGLQACYDILLIIAVNAYQKLVTSLMKSLSSSAQGRVSLAVRHMTGGVDYFDLRVAEHRMIYFNEININTSFSAMVALAQFFRDRWDISMEGRPIILENERCRYDEELRKYVFDDTPIPLPGVINGVGLMRVAVTDQFFKTQIIDLEQGAPLPNDLQKRWTNAMYMFMT